MFNALVYRVAEFVGRKSAAKHHSLLVARSSFQLSAG